MEKLACSLKKKVNNKCSEWDRTFFNLTLVFLKNNILFIDKLIKFLILNLNIT